MDYMTLKEASEKWGVTPRRINYYCAADRICSGRIRFSYQTYLSSISIQGLTGELKWGGGERHPTENRRIRQKTPDWI